MIYWGKIRVDKSKLGQIMTLLNFTSGKLFMWIGANITSRRLDEWVWAMLKPAPTGLISLLACSCERGSIITRYHFLEPRQMI